VPLLLEVRPLDRRSILAHALRPGF
jgi:hypothetical protein